MKTLDNNYFYSILENANYGRDLARVEEMLEMIYKNNYECKNYDTNYRENSFFAVFSKISTEL